MKWIKILLMTTCILFISSIQSEEQNKEARKVISTSGPAHVQFIELYSSESCSSCPPADKWISNFKNAAGLWKTFVPIVFHVDYWNHLGWKDNLSSKEMTKRQIDLSRLWSRPSVYTPAVVADGKEWSKWRDSKDYKLPEFEGTNSGILLTILQEKDDTYTIKVEGTQKNEKYIISIAELGMGLISKITSGENSGETFEHNFVVLSLGSKQLSNIKMEVNFKIPKNNRKVSRSALVAWIEKNNIPVALQTTGNYL